MAQVAFTGRLVKDPDIRDTSTGKKVCNITVAEKVFGRDEANFHQVTLWGKTAEFAAKYSGKGDRVFVAGRGDYEEYEREGVTIKAFKITANQYDNLETKKEREAKAGKGDDIGF